MRRVRMSAAPCFAAMLLLMPVQIVASQDSLATAFDRKEYAFAAQGFKQVLDVMADQDVGSAANQPPLSDLRTLAGGFHELAAKAAAPPPPPPTMLPAVADNRPAPHVYSTDDVNV